jgi:hypothetical protein
MDYLSQKPDSGEPEKNQPQSQSKKPVARKAPPVTDAPDSAAPAGASESVFSPDAASDDGFPVDAVAERGDAGDGKAGGGERPPSSGNGGALETEALSLPGFFGDRAHHLALSQSAAKHVLRKEPLVNDRKVGKSRPMTRAECARARSAHNFCDPAHPAGCGGTFCGMPAHARMGSDLI